MPLEQNFKLELTLSSGTKAYLEPLPNYTGQDLIGDFVNSGSLYGTEWIKLTDHWYVRRDQIVEVRLKYS